MFFNRIRFKHNNQIVSSATSLASSSIGVAVVDEVTGTVWEKTTKGTFVKQKSSSIPVGAVIHFANSTVPDGFIKCNGAKISRTTYANLFSSIGTTYGAGDGSTTFTLPDLRGEFIRGFDDGRGVDSGRTLGTQQGYDWKGFYMMNTGQSTSNYSHGEVYHGKSTTGYNGNTFVGYWNAPSATLGTKWDTSEIRPRNIAMMYCIKY